MTPRQTGLDPRLALQQPVQRLIEFVLVGVLRRSRLR